MKGHWEFKQPNGDWVECVHKFRDLEDVEETFSYPYILLHRFVKEPEHKHVFNTCECGEVKE